MVSNIDIKEEFQIFSEGFQFYKESLPVHSDKDDSYWNDVMQKSNAICEKHNSEFCNDYIQVLLKDLSRKAKEVCKNE